MAGGAWRGQEPPSPGATDVSVSVSPGNPSHHQTSGPSQRSLGQSHPSPVDPVPHLSIRSSLRLPPAPISNDLKALGGRTNSVTCMKRKENRKHIAGMAAVNVYVTPLVFTERWL